MYYRKQMFPVSQARSTYKTLCSYNIMLKNTQRNEAIDKVPNLLYHLFCQ